MVRGARLQRGAPRPGGGAADAEAPLLSRLHQQDAREGGRARRAARCNDAGEDVEGVLQQFRLGGERHRDQARLVLQQRAWAPRQEEDYQPHQGLSRRHRRDGEPHRPRAQSPRFRPADREHPSRRLPASLPLCRAGRERGGLRYASRRVARRANPARGSGDGRGLHRRAGDGRGRRDRAAAELFRESPGRAARSTTCC